MRTGGRLLVQMPPRHGKSETVSVWTPIWLLNAFPARKVMLASYEADFAAGWGRRARNLIEEHGNELLVRLAPDSTAANRWNTPEGGGIDREVADSRGIAVERHGAGSLEPAIDGLAVPPGDGADRGEGGLGEGRGGGEGRHGGIYRSRREAALDWINRRAAPPSPRRPRPGACGCRPCGGTGA